TVRSPSEKDADVLRVQDRLVQDDGAPGDSQPRGAAAQHVGASADEDVPVVLQAGAVDGGGGLHLALRLPATLGADVRGTGTGPGGAGARRRRCRGARRGWGGWTSCRRNRSCPRGLTARRSPRRDR